MGERGHFYCGLTLKDQGETIVALYDRDRATATALATELGSETAATPARVAELAEIIVTVVSDDAAMRQIFSPTGTESLLRHAKDRLFINCTTLSPDIHIEVEALGRNVEAEPWKPVWPAASHRPAKARSISCAEDGRMCSSQ